ncbi:MAG: sulfate ABC transporter substrate-binding protein [Nocardioidaceae bacterium]
MRTILNGRRTTVLATTAVVGLLTLTACGGNANGSTSDTKKVNVVGFSTLQTANAKLFADFQKTPAGKGVSFVTSYGASGDQSRAVAAGLKADEVHLSLEPDVTSLMDDGIVAKNWKDGPNKGVLTQSVVVIVVRKGNPLHITGWDDLTRPGVKVVTPNPGSSGSAKWNILAAYGHVIAGGGTPAQAASYLTGLFNNVVSLPGSGHDATTAFESGTGNVLLSYEDEAIEARQAGADFDYIVPAQSLLIQNTGTLTRTASPTAKAFYTFQLSKQGQTDYAEEGFRPLDPSIHVPVPGANDPNNPFPAPKTLLTIDGDFGGWAAANARFFDENNGIVTKIMAATGRS